MKPPILLSDRTIPAIFGILDCWRYAGKALAVCWQIAGRVPAKCWLYAGKVLAVCQQSAGCMPFSKIKDESILKTLFFSAACKALHGVRNVRPRSPKGAGIVIGSGPSGLDFSEKIFGLVTAFSLIQNLHQLVQVFLSGCNGWHWPDDTPVYGSVGIRQDDAVTSQADRLSLLEADLVFKGAPCPLA